MKPRLTAFLALASLSLLTAEAARAKPGSDGEKVAFLHAIHDHEIEAAEEARGRDVPQPVKDFAAHMIEEHTKSRHETDSVSLYAVANAEDTPAVKAFEEKAESKRDAMRKLDDAAFAKAYAAATVEDHAGALKRLDAFLKDSQGLMKDHLLKTRARVAAHLAKAKELQAAL